MPLDIEGAIRSGAAPRTLRGFGLKVGVTTRLRYAARIRELVTGHPMLERLVEPMLRARTPCGRSSPRCTGSCWPSCATTRPAGG